MTMSRIACGFPPTRRIACPISMGHYQRDLVLLGAEQTEGPGDGLRADVVPGALCRDAGATNAPSRPVQLRQGSRERPAAALEAIKSLRDGRD
ncbi:MAG: hypothetical protein V3U93_07540, partial [Alphaproteobacteria bacterium]